MKIELTLEQQLPKEKLAELLIESVRQGMVKDNTLRSLLKDFSR